MATAAPIPFFTDHNVPDSVGAAIVAANHTLTRLRECMSPDSDDKLIAVTCARSGQVLVSHDNDFKEITKRLQLTRFKNSLHRIDLKCSGPVAAGRMRDVLSLIEHEWFHARLLGIPMLVTVGSDWIRVRR
jgi:predicted nuclease of predicted toxin-antitoxin system